MASDDTARLVVALEARINAFEKAMDAAAQAADKSVQRIEGSFANLNKELEKQFKGMLSTAQGALGGVGSLLGALGPYGIAAATVLGAVVLAFNKATEAAEKLGDKAKELHAFSVASGLTLQQIQALNKVASEFGVTGDQVSHFVERFASAMDEAQRATGTLYEAVLRINPRLADELQRSQTTAEALEILGRAYEEAGKKGDKFAQAALARAAGGRAGLEVAPVLKGLVDAGGFDSLVDKAKAAGTAIDTELLETIRRLKIELDETRKRTETLFALIGSKAVLEAQVAQAKAMERLAKAAKDLADQKEGLSLFQQFFMLLAQQSDAAEGAANVLDEINAKFAATQRIQQQLSKGGDLQKPKWLEDWQSTLDRANQVPTPQARPSDVIDIKNIEADINKLRAWGAAMSDAITPAEQLALKRRELDLQLAKNVITQTDYNRELSAYTTAQAIAKESARERLGVATEEEISLAKRLQLQEQVRKGAITSAQDIALAEQIIQKESRQTYEALLVRASAFPELKRASLDAQNMTKQLDQFGVRAIDNLADSFVDVVNGTKDVKTAFSDMARSILNDLSKILVKKALFMALDAILPGSGSVGSLAMGFANPTQRAAAGGPISGPTLVGEKGPEIFVPNTSGMVIPNDALGSLGGINIGGSQTAINIAGSADRQTLAIMQAMLAERDKRFIADVASASRELRRRSVRT